MSPSFTRLTLVGPSICQGSHPARRNSDQSVSVAAPETCDHSGRARFTLNFGSCPTRQNSVDGIAIARSRAPSAACKSRVSSCKLRSGCVLANRTEVRFLSRMNKILRWLAIALVGLAVASSIGLLVRDARIGVVRGLSAAVISAVPLLAVGLSFLVVQAMVRPRWTELLKNLLLAATFLLWGVVQLMTQSVLSQRLGDAVVALYVVDLAWTILARVKVTGKSVD